MSAPCIWSVEMRFQAGHVERRKNLVTGFIKMKGLTNNGSSINDIRIKLAKIDPQSSRACFYTFRFFLSFSFLVFFPFAVLFLANSVAF